MNDEIGPPVQLQIFITFLEYQSSTTNRSITEKKKLIGPVNRESSHIQVFVGASLKRRHI